MFASAKHSSGGTSDRAQIYGDLNSYYPSSRVPCPTVTLRFGWSFRFHGFDLTCRLSWKKTQARFHERATFPPQNTWQHHTNYETHAVANSGKDDTAAFELCRAHRAHKAFMGRCTMTWARTKSLLQAPLLFLWEGFLENSRSRPQDFCSAFQAWKPSIIVMIANMSR